VTLTRKQELKLYGAAVNRQDAFSFIEGAATLYEMTGGNDNGFFNAVMEAYSASGQPSGCEWLRSFGERYFAEEQKGDDV